MAYPFPRAGTQGTSASYDEYRPSSRHDLFLDKTNAPAIVPPRLETPRPTSPFNPYSRTEDIQGNNRDYNPPHFPGEQYQSLPKTKLNPYEDQTLSKQPFEPLHPSQSYQDSYMRPRDSYSPYTERREGNPSPPLPIPPKRRTLFSRLFNGDQKRAYFCLIISVIQIGVFIGELVKNAMVMQTPIQTQPTFNPLIGPSSLVLVNMGAKFPACMHAIPGITDRPGRIWPCLNNTSNPPASGPLCTLEEICGFGGFHGNPPDQWFRLIVPIFLHGGVIHILFNLLVQLRLGADMEKVIGTVRFVIIYFVSGIMGFILGANFAGNGVASTGCSGALFGIIAIVILDLFYNWRDFKNPKRQLFWILIQVIICFGLGLLPGLDNFSHIGGFVTGLLLGIAVMRAPPKIRARLQNRSSSVYDLDASYSSLTGRGASSGRRRGLLGYFKGRKGWWWIWNIVRISCLTFIIISMALLFNNFYANGGGHCSWCRYLSCLPVNGWCELQDIRFEK